MLTRKVKSVFERLTASPGVPSSILEPILGRFGRIKEVKTALFDGKNSLRADKKQKKLATNHVV
ncbi:hypothetical protein [Streptococcus halichoeri]|uniref:hypothetical protein n=1 Tax=Streptococcus halichoeri TaxID=254785 RepID=UPI0013592C0C|nr:hypothetical protein [Streptococcus halichoeri]